MQSTQSLNRLPLLRQSCLIHHLHLLLYWLARFQESQEYFQRELLTLHHTHLLLDPLRLLLVLPLTLNYNTDLMLLQTSILLPLHRLRSSANCLMLPRNFDQI